MFGALRGMLRPLLVGDAVALVFEDAADLPPLDTDEGKVSQILRNFISNALKFTERGEVRVWATADAETDTVTFTVRDTGIGIAEDDLELIFQEFGQVAHRAAAAGEGHRPRAAAVQKAGRAAGRQHHGGERARRGLDLLGHAAAIVSRGLADAGATAEEPWSLRAWQGSDAGGGGRSGRRLRAASASWRIRRYQAHLARARSARRSRSWSRCVPPRSCSTWCCWATKAGGCCCSCASRTPLPTSLWWSCPPPARSARRSTWAPTNTSPSRSIGELLIGLLDRLTGRRSITKVLLVDDEEVTRYLVRQLLPRGIVTTSRSRQPAWTASQRLQHERPDVILLDLNMPGMNGYQFLERCTMTRISRDAPADHPDRPRDPATRDEALTAAAVLPGSCPNRICRPAC